ncbi:aminotransferase [Psychromonas sp. MB-3u-54]|uniref:aminotransferase class V-fold PLP-dependent enzyme n=1 Tax=Psychromonas sp. MB-3u-54 TaxID=2058319 RepID=UPI000C32FE71|nr:aminotransferase class V-fold PLP-dependent enzyme [Psychromonas sp. MB-3u-54]PKH02361.1 aminotransferase [Psychromonas sp. MB-3u-54]
MSQKNNSQSSPFSRRDFLKTTTGIAIAGVLSGTAQASGSRHKHSDDSRDRWEDSDNHHSDKKFWEKISEEFILDPETTYMNIGTTGSMPRRVLNSYNDNNQIVASNPWDMQNKFGDWPHTTEMTDAIAAGFGADKDEIVISRNTTDGMVSIINGLDIHEGDVILTTHHEHVAAISPLTIAAKRYGAIVVYLEIPVYSGDNEISAQDFVDVFAQGIADAQGPVRLIAFSHITYKTGTTLPAKAICELATQHDISTLIDGAHTIGMMNVDFHDIGCDFYAGSGHKWQCGPGSTGILYVKKSSQEKLIWFINSSLGHIDSFSAQWKLQYKGNDNFPALQALTDSCKMWDKIGRDKIQEHVLDLSALCKDLLTDNRAFPFGRLYAPNIRELSSGITSFNPFYDQTDLIILTEFRDRLREETGYIIRTTDFKVQVDDNLETHALRISTHLFHNDKDVKGLVKAMAKLYRTM